MTDKNEILRRRFGYRSFRPGQEALIDALLERRDALGVMPTGAGKSVCYQFPALLLPGLTVVVSPLISLMKDQVAALAQAGIPAAYINSSLTMEEYRQTFRQVGSGGCKLLYIAPERLSAPGFLRLMEEVEVSLVAVDEAHCVSQWGQDFRPSYLKIAEFIASLPKRPPVGAFTATATAEVREDIVRLLDLRDPLCVTTGFDRPNLFFDVVRPPNKGSWLKDFLSQRPDQSGIVYCATRKTVESVCDNLRRAGFPATRYHAGLEDGERRRNQEDFSFDRARIMVATNAFGMGIDKSNVSFVVHYNCPKNLESYYQEAGRAGRDGAEAQCVLLFSNGDVQTAKFLLQSDQENEALGEEEREQVRRRDLQRLEQMVGYCKTTGCLRVYLLRYFGEEASGSCGNCGTCKGLLAERDITVEAQKILSGVARVERKYACGLGLALIARMLRGSKDKRIFQLGLDKLPTYGIMADVDRRLLREYMDVLLREGYLYLTEGEYPVLRLTGRAGEVLFRGEKVLYTYRQQAAPPRRGKTPPRVKESLPQTADGGLYGRLRALRTRLAQEEGVPAYIVFSNTALQDMAAKQPGDLAAFLQVSGVGEAKAARYGRQFLEEIDAWKREKEGFSGDATGG